MRRHLDRHDTRELEIHDHVGWIFEGRQNFVSAAVSFLLEGIELGQRVMYVVDDPHPEDLAGLGDVAWLEREGTLQLASIAEVYGQPGELDPDRQRSVFSGAVDEAERAGYDGIRVAADNSALTADPDGLSRWIRWEHTADEFIASNRVTGLCAFERNRLSPVALGDLAALHPVLVDEQGEHDPQGEPPFRLFNDADTLALVGECDSFGADQLYRLLAAAPRDGGLVVDLSAVAFLDHHALLALARLAEQGSPVVVRNPSPMVRQLWDLVGAPAGALRFEDERVPAPAALR